MQGAPDAVRRLLGRVLVHDLAEVAARGALPPDVHTLDRRTLPGPYFLQVNDMVDVARSAMAQLDELDGLAPTTEASAMDEIFGPAAGQATQATQGGKKPAGPPAQRRGAQGRMLRLTLTDGVQTVTAMEYQPTPALGNLVGVGGKVGRCGSAHRPRAATASH